MPAIDSLFQRAHRQIRELESQLANQEDNALVVSTNQVAVMSAAIGSIGNVLREIDQLLKRAPGTTHREQYNAYRPLHSHDPTFPSYVH
jgi:hypothetical protein